MVVATEAAGHVGAGVLGAGPHVKTLFEDFKNFKMDGKGDGGGLGGPSIGRLEDGAKSEYRNGETKVARSIQKHGARTTSVFPRPGGNLAQRNEAAARLVQEILHNPKAVRTLESHYRFGKVIDIRILNSKGRGLRFDEHGNFIHVLEPNR